MECFSDCFLPSPPGSFNGEFVYNETIAEKMRAEQEAKDKAKATQPQSPKSPQSNGYEKIPPLEADDEAPPPPPPRKVRVLTNSSSAVIIDETDSEFEEDEDTTTEEEEDTWYNPLKPSFSASMPSFDSVTETIAYASSALVSALSLTEQEKEKTPTNSFVLDDPEIVELEEKWHNLIEREEDILEKNTGESTEEIKEGMISIARQLCVVSQQQNEKVKAMTEKQQAARKTLSEPEHQVNKFIINLRRSKSASMSKEEILLIKIEKKLRNIAYELEESATIEEVKKKKFEMTLLRGKVIFLRSQCHCREQRISKIQHSASYGNLLLREEIQPKEFLRIQLLILASNVFCDLLDSTPDDRCWEVLNQAGKCVKRLAAAATPDEVSPELVDVFHKFAGHVAKCLKKGVVEVKDMIRKDLISIILLNIKSSIAFKDIKAPPKTIEDLRILAQKIQKLELGLEFLHEIQVAEHSQGVVSNAILLDSVKIVVNSVDSIVTLTTKDLIHSSKISKTCIRVEDILSVERQSKSTVVVHSFPVVELDGKQPKRQHEKTRFSSNIKTTLDLFVTNLETLIAPRKRRVLILVNPFSGKKEARKVFRNKIKPVFDLASSYFEYHMIETSYGGHAFDIVKEEKTLPSYLKMSDLDGVVCVSGDGLLFEVINGFMQRPDWATIKQRLVFGAIAGGSANGLCTATASLDPTTASFYVARGFVRPLDLYSVEQDGEPIRYGFLQHSWAMLSDVDFESEKYRWLGEMRFTIQAIKRIAKMRKYEGRLAYLPASSNEHIPCTYYNCPICEENIGVTRVADNVSLQKIEHELGKEPEQWVVVTGRFLLVCLSNVPDIGASTMITPYAHIADGTMDLVFIKDDVHRTELSNIFLKFETGEHVHHPKVHYVKVKAYTLEPQKLHDKYGLVGSDGERLPHKALKIAVQPSLINYFGRP